MPLKMQLSGSDWWGSEAVSGVVALGSIRSRLSKATRSKPYQPSGSLHSSCLLPCVSPLSDFLQWWSVIGNYQSSFLPKWLFTLCFLTETVTQTKTDTDVNSIFIHNSLKQKQFSYSWINTVGILYKGLLLSHENKALATDWFSKTAEFFKSVI